jgi:two-component system cell cycle response regulator CpdR
MERPVPLRRDDARLLDEGARATVQGPATRLLVADDDDAIREMIARALCADGFDVVTAKDGAEALALFHSRGPYGLLLLDEEMPGLTGCQLLTQLRSEGVVVPALLHSGSLELTAADAMRLGAMLLRKPASLTALAAAVRQTIAAQRMK